MSLTYKTLGCLIHTYGSSLTHWGRVTHICISEIIIIGSDNGLSPGRRQAIIWTNAGILLIGPLWINFSEILIEINAFSFNKMPLKVSSVKWRLFRFGLNVLTPTMAPIPLRIFRSNLKLDQNLQCSGLKCTQPITSKFCTGHDSNFAVICYVYFKLEHSKFWSNFKFDRNIVGGTGAWTASGGLVTCLYKVSNSYILAAAEWLLWLALIWYHKWIS